MVENASHAGSAPSDAGNRCAEDAAKQALGGTVAAPHESTDGALGAEHMRQHEHAAAALQQSEQFARRLIEHLYTFVGVLDLDGNMLMSNQAPLKATGLAAEEVWGRPLWDTPTWNYSRAEQEKMQAAFARAKAGEVVRYLGYCKLAGDRLACLDMQMAPLRDDAGHVTHVIPSAVDVTDREAAETTLREADRRKDEFLATLAHELRNPLAPIATAVELLRMYPPRDAVQQQARDIIERQVRHMARLIDDLLDVSRISRGKLTIRPEEISLGAILDQALEAVQPHLNAAGHLLAIDVPPEPIVLNVDGVRIAQVLANLLQNSAKYTNRGGTVRLAAKTCGDEVEICVEDSGIGIAPEQLPHIFEMFWQGADAKQLAQGGLGIGLPLVRGLVELHGGSVAVRSDGLGCGSAFTVRLPLATGGASPTRESDRPGQRATPRLRVLVADDNRDAACSLSMMLEKLGHEVRVAYDGLQALELAEQFRPEIALLDLGMPGADGYAVARRLRGAAWGHNALLVAVTGWGQPSDRARTEEAGFDRHAVKPLAAGELGELLALAAARRASGSGAQGRSAF